MKRCGNCKRLKAIYEFSRDRTHSDGRRTICKICSSKQHKEYWRKNAWRLTKRNDLYKHRSPEKYQEILAQQRLYKTKHIEATLLRAAQKRSKKLKLNCDLTLQDIFVPKICPLLGIKIKLNGFKNNRDTSPSIDRINPQKGYTKSNTWIISYRANRIKNDASFKELQILTKNLRKSLQKLRKP